MSEYFRQQAGLCEINDFLELQLTQQLQWMDENGMYCDKKDSDTYQPIMYDLVPRGLFALLLHRGYRGASYERIDAQRRDGIWRTEQSVSSQRGVDDRRI